MMKWFPRKKRSRESFPPFINRLLLRLNNALLLFSAWLGQKSMAWSKRKKTLMLGLFCIAFATGSFYTAWNPFQKKALSPAAIMPIRVIPLLPENSPATTGGIPQLGRIHRFKIHFDRLSRTDRGRRWRDSFLAVRPHLMDTIYYLEKIYNEDIKNEINGKKYGE